MLDFLPSPPPNCWQLCWYLAWQTDAFVQRMLLPLGRHNHFQSAGLLYLPCCSFCSAGHCCTHQNGCINNCNFVISDHQFPEKQHNGVEHTASEYSKLLPLGVLGQKLNQLLVILLGRFLQWVGHWNRWPLRSFLTQKFCPCLLTSQSTGQTSGPLP